MTSEEEGSYVALGATSSYRVTFYTTKRIFLKDEGRLASYEAEFDKDARLRQQLVKIDAVMKNPQHAHFKKDDPQHEDAPRRR